MKLQWTSHFVSAYSRAPKEIQQAFDKQSLLLVQNPRHPSLHVKKYDEGESRWQARVTRNWRFYFRIQNDTYILLDIIPHPK